MAQGHTAEGPGTHSWGTSAAWETLDPSYPRGSAVPAMTPTSSPSLLPSNCMKC